jgi:flagellar L-ring protein precursor FlgH
MKTDKLIRRLAVVGFGALVLFSASQAIADDKKKKNRKTEKQVERIQPTPETSITTPEPPKPANGSLFTDDAAATSLVADFKPRRVGDLVFVDVVESSTATVTSQANRARESGTVGGLTTLIGAIPISGASTAAGVVTAMGNRKFEGKGSTERTSTVQARIVARVIEVLPNGDLRVEARKQVNINKENEWLSLSGIVRRRDVSAMNSIPTTQIGDLHVELNGKGVASADNAPGWLFRFFDKISPF